METHRDTTHASQIPCHSRHITDLTSYFSQHLLPLSLLDVFLKHLLCAKFWVHRDRYSPCSQREQSPPEDRHARARQKSENTVLGILQVLGTGGGREGWGCCCTAVTWVGLEVCAGACKTEQRRLFPTLLLGKAWPTARPSQPRPSLRRAQASRKWE